MEWFDQYLQQGYAVFEAVLPADLIDSHLAAFETMMERHKSERNGQDGKPRPLSREREERLFTEQVALYYEHESTLRLCLNPALRDILHVVFDGEEPLIGYPKTIIRGGGVSPHRDPGSFVLEPGAKFCRFWCALEDLHPQSGLVYIYPGAFGAADFQDRLLDEHPDLLEILRDLAMNGWGPIGAGMKRMAAFQRDISGSCKLEAEGRKKLTFQLKKGDVLLFQPNILHGSLDPDSGLTRKSLILDCQAISLRRYPPHAYYGSRHDYRRPENVTPELVVDTPWGKFVCEDWKAIHEWINKPITMD